MKHKVLAVVSLLFIADSAFAQYVIGDAKYTCPVGAAWNDPRCIREPVEQGANDRHGQANPSSPKPLGKWETTWGAIAVDPVVGDMGTVVGKRSEREAKREAARLCAKHGAKQCEVTSYHNQCGVVAWPSAVGASVTTQSGPTIEVASQLALSECNSRAGANCRIVYSDCTKPNFNKF